MRKLIYYQQQDSRFLCNENHVEITVCAKKLFNYWSVSVFVEEQTLQWQGFWQKFTVGNGYSSPASEREFLCRGSHGQGVGIFGHGFHKENAEKDDSEVGSVPGEE